jgi:hypothetical protein
MTYLTSCILDYSQKLCPCGAIGESADDRFRVMLFALSFVGSIPGRALEKEISAEYKIILKSGVGEMITPAPVP